MAAPPMYHPTQQRPTRPAPLVPLSQTWGDRDYVLGKVRENGLDLRRAAGHLCQDKEVIMEAVSQNGLSLEFAASDLQRDHEVVSTAIRENGIALRFAADHLQADKKLALDAVKQSGWALEFVSADLRNDREVVLEAVQRRGRALRFASRALRADYQVAMVAVKQRSSALQFVAAHLQSDRLFVTQAFTDLAVATTHPMATTSNPTAAAGYSAGNSSRDGVVADRVDGAGVDSTVEGCALPANPVPTQADSGPAVAGSSLTVKAGADAHSTVSATPATPSFGGAAIAGSIDPASAEVADSISKSPASDRSVEKNSRKAEGKVSKDGTEPAAKVEVGMEETAFDANHGNPASSGIATASALAQDDAANSKATGTKKNEEQRGCASTGAAKTTGATETATRVEDRNIANSGVAAAIVQAGDVTANCPSTGKKENGKAHGSTLTSGADTSGICGAGTTQQKQHYANHVETTVAAAASLAAEREHGTSPCKSSAKQHSGSVAGAGSEATVGLTSGIAKTDLSASKPDTEAILDDPVVAKAEDAASSCRVGAKSGSMEEDGSGSKSGIETSTENENGFTMTGTNTSPREAVGNGIIAAAAQAGHRTSTGIAEAELMNGAAGGAVSKDGAEAKSQFEAEVEHAQFGASEVHAANGTAALAAAEADDRTLCGDATADKERVAANDSVLKGAAEIPNQTKAATTGTGDGFSREDVANASCVQSAASATDGTERSNTTAGKPSGAADAVVSEGGPAQSHPIEVGRSTAEQVSHQRVTAVDAAAPGGAEARNGDGGERASANNSRKGRQSAGREWKASDGFRCRP